MDKILEDFEAVDSHQDVNGKWGGRKAWLVSYKHKHEDNVHSRLEVYRHVGEYYEIGNWPDDYGPSKWELVNRCVEFMDGTTTLSQLILTSVEYYIKIHWGRLGKLLLTFPMFSHVLDVAYKAWRNG